MRQRRPLPAPWSRAAFSVPRRTRRRGGGARPFLGGLLGGVLLAALAQGFRWGFLTGALSPGVFTGGALRGALVFNKGLAFSLFSEALPGALLAGGGVLVLGCLVAWCGRRLSSGAWAFCWGGALSNAFERWTEGGVLDYLGVCPPWGGAPIFLNVADLFLMVGVLWSLVDLGRWDPPEPDLRP
ncbi:MAG TPA: signal peptidase II [Synergistaceae bacterium]|nr:signal peptidase II [Synergistaceae bacterium]